MRNCRQRDIFVKRRYCTRTRIDCRLPWSVSITVVRTRRFDFADDLTNYVRIVNLWVGDVDRFARTIIYRAPEAYRTSSTECGTRHLVNIFNTAVFWRPIVFSAHKLDSPALNYRFHLSFADTRASPIAHSENPNDGYGRDRVRWYICRTARRMRAPFQR